MGSSFRVATFGKPVATIGLQQEFITPSTPEQNGLIERFYRSLKEECVWQHVFPNFEGAR